MGGLELLVGDLLCSGMPVYQFVSVLFARRERCIPHRKRILLWNGCGPAVSGHSNPGGIGLVPSQGARREIHYLLKLPGDTVNRGKRHKVVRAARVGHRDPYTYGEPRSVCFRPVVAADWSWPSG